LNEDIEEKTEKRLRQKDQTKDFNKRSRSINVIENVTGNRGQRKKNIIYRME